jgi:hypothetical protein
MALLIPESNRQDNGKNVVKRTHWGQVLGKALRFLAFPLVLRAEKKAREGLVSRGPNEEFEREIRSGFAPLFEQHGARIVANDWYPINGRSTILIVEVQSIRLRATTDRGCVAVDIAPSHSPTDWHLVEKILTVIFGFPYGYVSLSELGKTLSERLGEIEAALTRNDYARTIATLDSSLAGPPK